MKKEYCPHCSPEFANPTGPYIQNSAKAFQEAELKHLQANTTTTTTTTTAKVEKKSATMLSLNELYHLAQALENQAQMLRDSFGLVIAAQPSAPKDCGQFNGVPVDCELIGRLEEIGRCLRRTLATHEETLELRRV